MKFRLILALFFLGLSLMGMFLVGCIDENAEHSAPSETRPTFTQPTHTQTQPTTTITQAPTQTQPATTIPADPNTIDQIMYCVEITASGHVKDRGSFRLVGQIVDMNDDYIHLYLADFTIGYLHFSTKLLQDQLAQLQPSPIGRPVAYGIILEGIILEGTQFCSFGMTFDRKYCIISYDQRTFIASTDPNFTISEAYANLLP